MNKIGYTVWEWSVDNEQEGLPLLSEPQRHVKQAIKDISFLGYRSMEHFNMIVDFYRDNEDEFAGLLEKHNVTFDCIYHSLTGDDEADTFKAEECFRFLNKVGGQLLSLQAKPRPANNIVSDEELALTAIVADRIGKLGVEYGVSVCLHPHYATLIETEYEIDYFAEHTNPEYVNFCLDTGQMAICGMDPVVQFEKHMSRLIYVHLKDVDPDPKYRNVLLKSFVALGQGTVDIQGVVRLLSEKGYQGILCVEMDCPKVNNFQSAQYSMQYLRDVVFAGRNI